MRFISSLAAFGLIEVIAGTTLGLFTHKYLLALNTHIIIPFVSGFININNSPFIKETIIFLFSVSLIVYILEAYTTMLEKELEV